MSAPQSFAKCRMIGCAYEASGDVRFSHRAMRDHLSEAHGVGRPDPNKTFLGCFYKGCGFQASGSEKDVVKQLKEHMISTHGVDPENPVIPEDARRPRRGHR